MNKPKLINISDLILANHREISELYSEYAKSVGLTFSSLVVLSILWKEKDCTQSIIMKKSCFPKQTVNTIIKSFIKQGILNELTELKSDKRNKLIKFTDFGKKYADDIMLEIQNAECYALDMVGEKKARMLSDIIAEYKNNLKLVINNKQRI